jgi:hypothetical protein
MKPPIDSTVQFLLGLHLKKLEEVFDADVFTYNGAILNGNVQFVLKLIEELANSPEKKDRLLIVLTTGGGSASAVERMVNIVRNFYTEVDFIIPDYAYSAGTIFCMSGDKIYMDYYSVLGPIDPQVQNKEGKLVAALGYLDKVNELLEKAKNGTLTDAEFLILREMDLAELREYEQAKQLTIALLEKWLVKYKFKNWTVHETNPGLVGQAVTEEEKAERAKEIADKLSDNNLWKSHSRPINIETLEKELRLQIEDYSKDLAITQAIRQYYELVSDYMASKNFPTFVQTREFV